jgi:hypothetical protein
VASWLFGMLARVTRCVRTKFTVLGDTNKVDYKTSIFSDSRLKGVSKRFNSKV